MLSNIKSLRVVFIIYLVAQQYCVCANNQSTVNSSNKIEAENVWERRKLETSEENSTDLPDIMRNETTTLIPISKDTDIPALDTRLGIFIVPRRCPPGKMLVDNICGMKV